MKYTYTVASTYIGLMMSINNEAKNGWRLMFVSPHKTAAGELVAFLQKERE